MSSMTAAEVGEKARNRLNLKESDAPRLISLISDALKSLAIKVANREDWQALRKEISVTCTSGIITLADTSLLTEVLLSTGELLLDGRFVKWAPSFQELTLKMPADVYRASLRGSTKIYVTDLVTGALGAVTQNGTLAFNYVPTLTDLPDAYDEQVVDEVVVLAMGKVEKAPASKFLNDEKGLDLNLNAN